MSLTLGLLRIACFDVCFQPQKRIADDAVYRAGDAIGAIGAIEALIAAQN